jgi:very-short-patch-repair endonuclease
MPRMRPDLDDLVPLLDPSAPPRVLTLAEAERLGWRRGSVARRVRAGTWQRLLPRVYLTSDTLLWDDKLRAAIKFAGEGALLSGAAALADRGLTSVPRPARVLVLVPGNRAPRSSGWVQVRPSDRPVTSEPWPGPQRARSARAVSDLALERSRLDDVRALVAEAVRKDLCTIEELAFELQHCPRRGSAHLRQAVDEVRLGAWSAPEARAGTLLRGAALPPFEQNARIDVPGGRHFIVDFLWRELRAVLEIDSDAHHALAGHADRTSDRHLVLETMGFSVIHRTPAFIVRHPSEFVAGIAAWLAARTTEFAR